MGQNGTDEAQKAVESRMCVRTNKPIIQSSANNSFGDTHCCSVTNIIQGGQLEVLYLLYSVVGWKQTFFEAVLVNLE